MARIGRLAPAWRSLAGITLGLLVIGAAPAEAARRHAPEATVRTAPPHRAAAPQRHAAPRTAGPERVGESLAAAEMAERLALPQPPGAMPGLMRAFYVCTADCPEFLPAGDGVGRPPRPLRRT